VTEAKLCIEVSNVHVTFQFNKILTILTSFSS